MNNSFNYNDISGCEPDVSDFKDLQRWTKWNAWHRKRNNSCCWSCCNIDANGFVHYDKLLKSQKFRCRYFKGNI